MQTIIDKELFKKAEASMRKMGKVGTVAKKLNAVMASYKHGIKLASEVMEVSRSSIYLWSRQIKEGKVEELRNKSKHQDGIKVKKAHKEAIKVWLTEDPSLGIKEVKQLLEEEYNIAVSRSTVHRVMRNCGFSYITSRKQHYKQDKERAKIFKK